MTPYASMLCPSCSAQLYLEDEATTVTIRCLECGPLQNVYTRNCTGPRCDKRIFMGGKGGKSPIAVETGESHFIDCVDAPNFRRKPRETAPVVVAKDAPKQGGFAL